MISFSINNCELFGLFSVNCDDRHPGSHCQLPETEQNGKLHRFAYEKWHEDCHNLSGM